MTDQASISDDELEEIERRAAAASPAPWESFVFPNPNDDDFIRIGGVDDSQPDMYVQHYLGAGVVQVPGADLDFIAHARQDIPRLVAEVRRLKANTERGETTK
jgi:hypothetical protein